MALVQDDLCDSSKKEMLDDTKQMDSGTDRIFGAVNVRNGKTQATPERSGKGDRSMDYFTEPPFGVCRYAQVLAHFPLEAPHCDEETHSISFNLPPLPLTRDRNGHPYIGDITYQVGPGVWFHTYCERGEQSLWSEDIQRMIAERSVIDLRLKMYLKIERAMYETSTPLTGCSVDLCLRKGGKKHVHVSQDFWSADRSQRVMRALTIGVFFNTVTKTIIDLPEQLVSALPCLEPELIPDLWHQEEPAPPTNAFRYAVEVAWSHVDINGHMGFQWFVQHAFDAFALAVTSQETEAFPTLTFSNMAAGVSSLSVDYLKDCCYGDQLDLLVWQDGAHENTAHCWIERQGKLYSKVIFTFYYRSSPFVDH